MSDIKVVAGKETAQVSVEQLLQTAAAYSRTAVDLGTGDGLFSYWLAQNSPDTFVIAIDAAAENMREASRKAAAKPARGGLSNLIYIWSSVEQLPDDLSGFADTIYINFPWAGLLKGLMLAEAEIVRPIVRMLKPGGTVEALVSYDARFEPRAVVDWGLPELDRMYLAGPLAEKLVEFGLKSVRASELDPDEPVAASWPKRILASRERRVYRLALQKEGSDQSVGEEEEAALSYSFYAQGHPNIRASHARTIELTSSAELTARGDCIVGVKADFDPAELKKFRKKARMIFMAEGKDGETSTHTVKFKVNPDFNSADEIVLRKSGFTSQRTFGLGLDHGASRLDRDLIELLHDPATRLKIEVRSGWAD